MRQLIILIITIILIFSCAGQLPAQENSFRQMASKNYTGNTLGVSRHTVLLLSIVEKELIKKEKELIQLEKELYLEIEKRQRMQIRLLIYLSVGFIIIFVLSVFLFLLYRSKNKAYRALLIKNQQWAQQSFIPISPGKPHNSTEIYDENDRQLFNRLNLLMAEEKIYLNPKASLDYVAHLMKVNRMYLSQAVNRCTGDNFSTFINELRVKEAVRLMSDKNKLNHTIESIALDAGFNERTTFYRVFKKVTGFSPAAFLKN
jgi:AraC-like DNA-binding protein